MKRFWSAQTGGFYFEGVNASIPADAVEITPARHRELLDAQARGARLSSDTAGRPVSAMPRPPSAAQLRAERAAGIRTEAERRILAVAPLWRQSNDNAALAQELMNRIDGLASPAELTAEVAAAVTRRAWINAIRAASDLIEADLAGLTAAQLAAFDVAADPRWPEFEA